MVKNREINGTEEIALVTPTPVLNTNKTQHSAMRAHISEVYWDPEILNCL